MKNKIFAIFLALFFISCVQSKINSQLENNIAKYVEFKDLSKSIVKDLKTRTNLNGLLEFELILQSSSDKNIAYKVQWEDESGFYIKSPLDENYELVRLNAGRELVIKKLAHSQNAKDFKIFLQGK